MIKIFCARPSDGARNLVTGIVGLGGQAQRARRPTEVDPIDFVINWGSNLPRGQAAIHVLNPRTIHNKLLELERLQEQRVAVPPFVRGPKPTGWWARTINHHEANDLLANLEHGDYYVEPLEIIREFRIHSFNGHSIRAGIKVPRILEPHPTFRSWTAGWKLDYGQECQRLMNQSYRVLAAQACSALGYDFGAVDIGVKANGSAVVFEVNSAPGLEGNTTTVYARKFLEAANGV